jgi:predicted ester cyclase
MVHATGAIFCRLAGCKIVEQWDVDDRFAVMQQLGLFPMPQQTGA